MLFYFSNVKAHKRTQWPGRKQGGPHCTVGSRLGQTSKADPPPVRVLRPSEGLATARNKFGLVDVEFAFLDVDILIPFSFWFFLWHHVFITCWASQMVFPDLGDLCVSTVNDIAFFLQFVEDVVHILLHLLQLLVQHRARLGIRCCVSLQKL